jgi:DNA-binding transcriptional LysR family regulator
MDYINEIRAFVEVCRKGTMSAAAREMDLSVASVSKRIAHLEERLSTRLFHRTTRRLSLTDSGRVYEERCGRILADIEEAEAAVAGLRDEPRGELRVSASVSFGRKHVAPVVARFLAQYPEVSVHLQLTDQVVNLVDEGLDLAIRIGQIRDESLVAKRLAPNLRTVCATPGYLERFGIPRTPDDLATHNCLVLSFPGSSLAEWPFQYPGGRRNLRVSGTLTSNNGEAVLQGLMAGVGLSLQSTWNVGGPLMRRELLPVLGNYMVPDLSVYAVYPSVRHTSAKVRVFIDMMAEAIGPEPYWDQGLGELLDVG